MYEVEVKASLKDRESVKKKLDDLGCTFSEELHQVDHIFIPKGISFPPPFSTPVLRIREQNGKSIFTLKISQTSRQDCIERETEISDGKSMTDIMDLIGYEEVTTVDKKRIKTKYKDMEIVLDDVKLLGEFIEAEKIVQDSDSEVRKKIQEELFEFLATIGITKEDHVIGGKYDIMVYEKLKRNQ
jgi:adenylate cyclase, class 2